jgi:hypothetical protein
VIGFSVVFVPASTSSTNVSVLVAVMEYLAFLSVNDRERRLYTVVASFWAPRKIARPLDSD